MSSAQFLFNKCNSVFMTVMTSVRITASSYSVWDITPWGGSRAV